MSQREYRIGPGAASLMLLVVVLSMCVLGVLALMGARSDEGLSLRSIQVAQEVARLNVQAERSLADLDEKLKAASETASQATSPSSLPMPYSSGCLLVRCASLYARKEAIAAPVPGTAPIKAPMTLDLSNTIL